MKVRFKGTLTKLLAGRGVIVCGGVAILLAVSSSELFTLLHDGFVDSSITSVRGGLAGLILCIALIIGYRWIGTALGIYLASAFVFFSDGTLLLWIIFSIIIFSALAGMAPSRHLRVWYLSLLAVWMVQFGLRAGDDAIVLVVLLPVAALAYGLSRSIFVLIDRSVRAVKDSQAADARAREAVDAERKNIARDLHDIVAHDITVVAMQSKAAKFANDGQMALEAIDIIAKLSTETLHDLRLMLNVLRTDGTMADVNIGVSGEPAATTVYVTQGVELFSQRLREANFEVTSHTDENISELPRSAQTALYRVMQEATTNVIKHGLFGGTCAISLTIVGAEAHLKVTNQMALMQISHDSTLSGGSGLIGMADRMRTFGGRFSTTERNGLWILKASIPV